MKTLLIMLSGGVLASLIPNPNAGKIMAEKQTQSKQKTKAPAPVPYSWVTSDFLAQLANGGVKELEAQKNFIWAIQSETGGKPRSEDLFYKTPERIVDVYKRNKLFSGLSREEAIKKVEAMGLVKNPEALGNAVYGGRMGNVNEGDGFRFRGRTGIQITGRANYEAVFVKMGMPKDTDPEVLDNNIELQNRAMLAFIQINGKGKNLSDINEVNKIIKPAVSHEERLRNNPMPSDDVILKAKPAEKKVSYEDVMSEVPSIAMDTEGNPTLDTRPSNA
jgi:predicted chitinase